jgi:hypothetical protein
MDTVQLGLEFPSSHDIYTNFKGDSLSQPIPASIIISRRDKTALNRPCHIRVCLVQRLSSRARDGADDNEDILSRVYNHLLSKPQLNKSFVTRSCSVIEELSLQLPDFPEGTHVENIQKVPFYMPILANIPGTTITGIGKISYFLIASMVTEDNSLVGTSKEIFLRRRTLLEQDSIQHTRIYPNSSWITKIILSQNGTGTADSTFFITAKIFLRWTATPAGRSTEFKCVAIRGLRWRIEEVATLESRPGGENNPENGSVEEKSVVRELSNGIQKGYWGTLHNPILANNQTHQQKDSAVDVAFEVNIPSAVEPAPEVEPSNYEFQSLSPDYLPRSLQEKFTFLAKDRTFLTTEHRLKLDILISEDTFDISSRKLVDRKPMRTALNASFPLRIVDKAEAHIDEMILTGNLPRYQEVSDSPPNYEIF